MIKWLLRILFAEKYLCHTCGRKLKLRGGKPISSFCDLNCLNQWRAANEYNGRPRRKKDNSIM